MEKSKAVNVLIIGGNGFIGQIIHELLLNRGTRINIIIGSRTTKIKNQINIDVTNPSSFHAIKKHNVNLIILCTSDKENNILNYCISNKTDYLDITKPTSELETAYLLANQKGVSSRIVFSSGWMSGIVGSLLNWVEPNLNKVNEVEIYIYYSLKDASGKTSADFMADTISKPFKTYKSNKVIWKNYYLTPKSHNYSFKIKKRNTYLFDTPDAFILNESENIPSIETRTTYSSKFTTWLLHCFQIIGIYKILSLTTKKKMFASNGKGDKTSFEIVYKNKNSTKKVSIQNLSGQANLTAFATVLHIEQLTSLELKNGIYFSHQLHDNPSFIQKLLTMKSIKIIKNEKNSNN